jgi:hypothetical protein
LAEVYSLQNKKKLGGEGLSESNSQLESPGAGGEGVYKNFTGKYCCGLNGTLMTHFKEEIKNFFK